MRFTKAQGFAISALGVPVLSFFASLAFFWARSLLGFEPWYEDDPRIHAVEVTGFAVAITAFLSFATFALMASKPSSTTWRVARRAVLQVLALPLVVVGVAVLGAHVAEPGPALRDVFLISAPLGFACCYAFARDSDPPRSRRDAAMFVVRATMAVIAIIAVGVLVVAGLHAIGAGAVWHGLGFFLMGLAALTILLIPLNLLSEKISRLRRGKGDSMFGGVFFGVAPYPMTREEAEVEWAAMRRIPQGGTLIQGWRYRFSPVLRLHCEGPDGRRHVLLGNVQKSPWPRRLVGLFAYSLTSSWPARKTKRGIHFQAQLDYNWTPLTDRSAEAELSKLGEASTGGRAAQAWSCPDYPTARFDLIDANGRDFLVLADVADDPEAFWFAGLFLGFAKAPTLASDRMGPSWPLPSATTSNPPPRTRPSSS